MTSRAIVSGAGGLRGAYGAGAFAVLGDEVDPEFFDTYYTSSVNAYATTFYTARQPDVIREVWLNRVHGKQTVNWWNKHVHNREILDLEYLRDTFQTEPTALDVDAVLRSSSQIKYVLTEYPNGKGAYISPKDGDLFALMNASCAVPIVHSPVEVDGRFYVDGGIADPLPVKKALKDGHDEVWVITNREKHSSPGWMFHAFLSLANKPVQNLIGYEFSKEIIENLRNFDVKLAEVEQLLESDDRIKEIRPNNGVALKHMLDTDKERLHATFHQGQQDMHQFLSQYSE